MATSLQAALSPANLARLLRMIPRSTLGGVVSVPASTETSVAAAQPVDLAQLPFDPLDVSRFGLSVLWAWGAYITASPTAVGYARSRLSILGNAATVYAALPVGSDSVTCAGAFIDDGDSLSAINSCELLVYGPQAMTVESSWLQYFILGPTYTDIV
jgi:hypothetical protein